MGKMFIATEAIDFQDTIFGKELEAVFKAIRENCKNIKDIEDGDYPKTLSGIVKNHTNMNVSFKFENFNNFCAFVPFFKEASILLNYSLAKVGFKYRQKHYTDIVRIADKYKKENYVDLKNAKVYGVFAEYKTEIHLGVGYILGKEKSAREHYFAASKEDLTYGEIAAITLHELGHLFTNYEYLSRVVTTNQVIAGLADSVTNQDTKKLEYELKLASQILNVDEKDLEKVKEAKSTNAVIVVVLDAINNNKRDILATPYYSQTSCEQLADQFAARWGYGKEIVTGLDKMFGGSRWGFTGASFFEAMMAIAINIMSYMFAASGMIGISIALFAFFFLYYFGVMKTRPPLVIDYDDNRTRLARVREQMIEKIKEANLKPEDMKVTLEAINEVTEIVNRQPSVFNGAWYFLNKRIPWRRKKLDMIELNRDLEELGANDLFLQAAILKTI